MNENLLARVYLWTILVAFACGLVAWFAISSGFGIGLFLILFNFFELSTWQLIFLTLIPTMLVAILAVRHAKAFYLAIDHYFFHEDNESIELRNID